MTTKPVAKIEPLSSLAELERALHQCSKAFLAARDDAGRAVQDARKAETELGVAQRALDARIVEMRRAAPPDSHWATAPVEGHRAVERALLRAS